MTAKSNEIKDMKNIFDEDGDTNNKFMKLSEIEYVNDKFIGGLESLLTLLDPIFDRLSLNERLEKFLESVEDQRRIVQLGSVVALYFMLRKFQIDDDFKLLILEKTISSMQNFESKEELFLVICLEICTLFAPCDLLSENLNLICMFLTDFNFPRLQRAAFNCLMSMEYEGIKVLVELASKDYLEYQRYILTSLLNTPHIQKIIILRALMNEVNSNNSDRRHSALAALNRMHDLVASGDGLVKLSKLFLDSKTEKIFLSSTIRTSGPEGEKILLREIRLNKDFSVRVAIASVLSYRLPKYPKYLKMKLDSNDSYSITKNLPGRFCIYNGKVSPYVYDTEDDESEHLEVCTRDFLAALQRMLTMNYDHSNPQIVYSGHSNLIENLNMKLSTSEIISKYSTYFELNNEDTINKNIGSEQTNNNGRILVTEDVIKTLCLSLRDYSTAVRDTAASSLGQIGLPESLLSIDYLVDSIKDEDVNVRAKVIWAIGRIAAGCDNSVVYSIVEALQSNMWKVKCACLFTLSQFGYRSAKPALPVLIKLLKESAINKQMIAETMVKLGNEGESTLLRMLNQENDSNYKLKSSIAKSLALSNIGSPNIDFIVENLFKLATSNHSLIRTNALFSVRILSEKAEEKVTYLKRKHIIPFYYEKLQDKEPTIQAYAISCIKSLGPQGELIFIEGLTKDVNPLVRQNSAIGLTEMGPHTFRTLLIGLHDENFNVRKTVEKEIIEKFSIQELLNCFGSDKKSQRMSLKISLRDILEKELPINIATKKLFENLLIAFENENTESYIDIRNNQNNQRINEKENSIYLENKLNNSNLNLTGKMSRQNYMTEGI